MAAEMTSAACMAASLLSSSAADKAAAACRAALQHTGPVLYSVPHLLHLKPIERLFGHSLS